SRLDLPQPFGPTTPVSPFSMTSSVGSTNDLKPSSRSRVICTSAPALSVMIEKFVGTRGDGLSEFLDLNHTNQTNDSSVPFDSEVRSPTGLQGLANFGIGTLDSGRWHLD